MFTGPMNRNFFFVIPMLILGISCSSPSSNQPTATFVKASDLSSLMKPKGKAVLVNVWATWCGPCVEEFPYIVSLGKKYEQDLEVLFISADFPQDTARVRTFLEEHEVPWNSYIKSGSDSEFIEALHPNWTGALPFTVLFNAQGNEVIHWENSADSAIFERYILEALKN